MGEEVFMLGWTDAHASDALAQRIRLSLSRGSAGPVCRKRREYDSRAIAIARDLLQTVALG